MRSQSLNARSALRTQKTSFNLNWIKRRYWVRSSFNRTSSKKYSTNSIWTVRTFRSAWILSLELCLCQQVKMWPQSKRYPNLVKSWSITISKNCTPTRTWPNSSNSAWGHWISRRKFVSKSMKMAFSTSNTWSPCLAISSASYRPIVYLISNQHSRHYWIHLIQYYYLSIFEAWSSVDVQNGSKDFLLKLVKVVVKFFKT